MVGPRQPIHNYNVRLFSMLCSIDEQTSGSGKLHSRTGFRPRPHPQGFIAFLLLDAFGQKSAAPTADFRFIKVS